MTQFYIDSDNGINTADGLTITRSGTVSITSSSVANPSNILCTGHGMVSTESTTIVGHSGSTPDINADHVITRIDDDNFTIPVNVTVGGTGGTSQELDGPFATFHQFTENTRSAGDIATCRRDMTAEYDDGGQLDFTSDGTLILPIVLEADYDDSWSDFANSAQTYTPVFGALTMTASATITGIVAGDWVFNTTDGDDPREFSYEVKSVVTTTLTLFIPWKGSTGATKTLKVMGSAPTWQTVSETNKWNPNADNYWKIQGIQIQGVRTSTTSGLFDINAGFAWQVIDVTFVSNNTLSYVFTNTSTGLYLLILKCRTFDGIVLMRSAAAANYFVKDCFLDGNSVANTNGFNFSGVLTGNCEIIDCVLQGHTLDDIAMASGSTRAFKLKLRNTQLNSSVGDNINNSNGPGNEIFIEDAEGVISVTESMNVHASADFTPIFESDTGTVRSGGSNISTKVTPGTNIGPESIFSTVTMLDIPIFATTASKKYEIFFRPDATANWTADPTATQLWIELEYWGHASNDSRRITKSTGVIDMNGSTTFTALDVTVAPSQAGVAYLRVKYTKPKESGKTNVFFFDPIPVIT